MLDLECQLLQGLQSPEGTAQGWPNLVHGAGRRRARAPAAPAARSGPCAAPPGLQALAPTRSPAPAERGPALRARQVQCATGKTRRTMPGTLAQTLPKALARAGPPTWRAAAAAARMRRAPRQTAQTIQTLNPLPAQGWRASCGRRWARASSARWSCSCAWRPRRCVRTHVQAGSF